MSAYQPTPEQEQAIREYLQEAVVPLIEQVLVKKLGQAMSFAAEELIQPKPVSKPWVGLSTIELDEIDAPIRERGSATIAEIYRAIEAKLKEKNT